MKNNHFHNHDGVYELSPITNRLLLVKPVTKRSQYTFSRRPRFFSRSFYCFTKHSFRQIWPRAVFKDYFRCFRGLEKAGFSEKKSCGSKCLFVDHRASRTTVCDTCRLQTCRLQTADLQTADLQTADLQTADCRLADCRLADCRLADLQTWRLQTDYFWIVVMSTCHAGMSSIKRLFPPKTPLC